MSTHLRTTHRLRIIKNKLRNVKTEHANCGYAGYHISGHSLIMLGHAESILRSLIEDRKERGHGNDLGS